MKYENHTNEELVSIIAATGDEEAYEQLFRNIDPITLHEAQMYMGKMDTYDREDFLQEGRILAWTIISKGSFKKGLFRVYFGSAIRKRLVNIYRTYTLKNLVCIDEQVDCRGNVTRTMVESDYARAYREKHREQCRAWYAKKKATQPLKEKKPPMSKEEKIARQVAYQKEYYAAHPDKLAERREKNRIRERERRASRKAAMMAAMA
jgi:hypothetical protein